MSKYQPLSLASDMPFGKHKGEQIEDLLYDQPTYITWLISEEIVEFDEDAMKTIEELKLT